MKAILTDVTRCTGCNTCVKACTEENSLGDDTTYRWSSNDGLSAQRFTSVVTKQGAHVRKQCRHCLEPACASACPVGALQKQDEGPVTYDSKKCLGCRYCMMACPFAIPRYDWGKAVPYVRKCTMCYEKRVSAGLEPACTLACPEKATIFGEREELLNEARRRLKASPERYLPQIFGEHEVGGTSVLYLAPIDLTFLQLGNKLDERPLPERTVMAMSAVPPTFVGVGALMGGLHWIISRRMKLAREGGDGQSSPSSAEHTAGKEES